MNRAFRFIGVASFALTFVAGLPAGIVEKWHKYYNAANASDTVAGVDVAADGSTYITGSSDLSMHLDIVTRKYDIDGNLLWSKRVDRASRDDGGLSVKVGPSGNVYVLGYTKSASFDQDIRIMKYDPAGNLLGSKDWNGGTGDEPRGLALDASENVYICGNTNSGTSQDVVVLKYDSALNFKFQKVWNDASNLTDTATGIAIKGTTIFVCGSARGVGTQEDMLCLKLDSASLTLTWAKTFDGPVNGSDIANAIAIDSSTQPVITGPSGGFGTDSDIWTMKLNSAGTSLWNVRKDGGAAKGDNSTCIGVDSSDNVYIGGKLNQMGTQSDMALIKYNSAGTQQWVTSYSSSGTTDEEEGRSLCIDAFGNVYLTGASLAMTTVVYSPAGGLLATLRPSHSINDRGTGVAVSSTGRVSVIGNWYIGPADEDMALYQYQVSTTILGQLTLNGKKASAPYPSSLTLELRDPTTHAVVSNPVASIDSVGAITVEIPQGTWEVSIKYRNWLRKTLPLISNGVSGTLDLSLINGDCSGDNEINILDLNKVLVEFAKIPGSQWTDMDQSGQVDISDVSIVLVNFTLIGDN